MSWGTLPLNSPQVHNILFTTGSLCAQSLSSSHSFYSHTIFSLDIILTFFSHLCLPVQDYLFPSYFPITILYALLFSILRAACPSNYAHVYIYKQNFLCIFWLYIHNICQTRQAVTCPVGALRSVSNSQNNASCIATRSVK